MHKASYPKETPDQWHPIAGDLSGWGGACNQSINTGCSPGEQDNLIGRTPPPLSDFLLFLPLAVGSFSSCAFLTVSPSVNLSPSLRSRHHFVTQCLPLPGFPVPSLPRWLLANSRSTGHTKARNAAGLERRGWGGQGRWCGVELSDWRIAANQQYRDQTQLLQVTTAWPVI